jgi:hypothetical protein
MDFGDGQNLEENDACFAHGPCVATSVIIDESRTYTAPGTYTITAKDTKGVLIGTAKVVVNKSASGVPGMQKYTDADFGFSFWYPSAWQVTKGKAGSSPDSLTNIRIVAPPFNSLAAVDINLTEHSGPATYAYQPTSNAQSMGGVTIQTYQAPSLPDWFSISWGSPIKSLDVSGRGIMLPLLRTVIATDSSVATPMSATQQQATIQAEKDAYAAQ